jgi:uncharacterized protein
LRIAVIADTHLPRGARRLPSECVRELRAADLIIHAGDILTAGVLREIEAFGPPVVAVQGNMDSAELARLLPLETTFRAGEVSIALVHDGGPAAGRLERMRRRFPDADAVIFGHSHLPLHEAGESFQIFNPGSPTERRQAPHHTMGIATVEHRTVTFEHVLLG